MATIRLYTTEELAAKQQQKNRANAAALGKSYTASGNQTSFAEMRLAQQQGLGIDPQGPSPKPKNYRPMGALVRSDSSKLSPKNQSWGPSYMPGGGGGGRRQAMSPLPPLQKLKRFTVGKGRDQMVTAGMEETMNDNLRRMRKEQVEKNKNDPEYQYRRRLWDLQMEKVGLTPEGRPLSGLRNIMIERMNQLRGGS